jgi:hypothetical protein
MLEFVNLQVPKSPSVSAKDDRCPYFLPSQSIVSASPFHTNCYSHNIEHVAI